MSILTHKMKSIAAGNAPTEADHYAELAEYMKKYKAAKAAGTNTKKIRNIIFKKIIEYGLDFKKVWGKKSTKKTKTTAAVAGKVTAGKTNNKAQDAFHVISAAFHQGQREYNNNMMNKYTHTRPNRARYHRRLAALHDLQCKEHMKLKNC